MSKYTPGPWKIDNDHPNKLGILTIRDASGNVPAIAKVLDSHGFQEANALLIAASPTLLEAAAASIEAIRQGEADIALIYLRHAVSQAVEGGAK